jgi:hypothetical protein
MYPRYNRKHLLREAILETLTNNKKTPLTAKSINLIIKGNKNYRFGEIASVGRTSGILMVLRREGVVKGNDGSWRLVDDTQKSQDTSKI